MALDSILFLAQLQQALGCAIPVEQQLFISANYHSVLAFLESETGKTAVQMFVEEWQRSANKKPA